MGKDNVIKIVAGTALIVGSIFVPGGALISGLLMSGGLGLVQGGVVGALRGDLPDRQTARMANPISEQADGSVIYGLYRVGGQIVEIRRHPTDEKVVYVVITICVGTQAGSGIEDVTKVYFDDRLAISDPDTSGALSTTGLSGTFDEHVQYAIHLGTNAQSVDAELTARFPAQWPSSSKGAGIAYAVLRLTYDGDVFPTGLPQITFEVKGQKLFDPRSSSTVWSANPALVIRDYLTSTKYGCAMTEAEIDDTTIIDAANYCDEVINTTAYNGPRFTCNGAAETGRPRRDNLAELLSACRGELVHQAGKFRLIVRRPTVATSFQLTEDNIVGDWEFVRAGADAPNSVTAAYVDPAREYQVREITWPDAGQSNGFLSADNGIAAHTRVELPFTTDYYIAQQIGMVALREAREDVTIAVTAKESALFLQPGDVVPVTHSTPGFSSKHFWVAALGILPDATVRLVLREYDANAYTLDTQNTEATVPGTDLPNPFFCEPPSDLELQSSSFTALATQEGQFLPRIRATWTASPDPFLSGYEIQYKESTASAWTAWIPHDRLATEAMIAPVTDRLQYDVRVRAVNTIGVHSAWVQDSVAASTRYVRPTSSTFGVVSTSSVPDVLVSLRGFANGDVRLSVTRADVGAAKGFAYKYSKNVPLNPLPTDSGVVQQNFLFADAESAVTFSSSDQLAEGQTAYVYVWPIGWPPGPISGAGPNGSIGRRIDVRWTRPVASVDTPHLAVDFDHHGMVPGMVAIRVDISDPANRGGTFRAWTAPTAVTSPNPAGSPDAEIAITSTPAYVRSQLPGTVSSAYVVPALAFAVGDGITKTCYVEFVPTGGTTSGKIPFEVVTPVLSVGNPNTHLDPRIRVGIAGGGPSSVGTSTGQGTHGPPLGGVASNAMNQSGNLFMRGQHPIAWERGFSSVGAEIGFFSGVQGAVLSFSATVVPNTADTVWSARVIFKDVDGATLATVTGFTTFRLPATPPGGWPPDQLPPAQGPIYLHNVTPPAGSVVVFMEPLQISGPASGAFFRHPVCTTGAIAQNPSPVPVPSAQHVAESGAAAAANATTTIAEWMARSGAQVGPPPSAIATQPIYDSFGMQVLVDTAERRITHVIAINDADTPLAVGPATVSDGLAPLPIVKGHLTGQAEGGSVSGGAWVNGAAVVLEQDIQNAPSVLLLGGGAAAEMRQQKWTNGCDPNRPVRIERDAIQVSAAGFIPRARFVQDLGTFTARDDNFPGTVIDVVDESVEVTLANSPAHDDKYTTRVQFTLNPGGWPADVPNGIAQYVGYVEAYFAIEFDDGGGYVERSGFFVSHGGPDSVNFVFQQSRQLAVSGMGSGDKVRVALRSLYLQNGLGSVSAVAQDVKYDTASSAASYASMTPDQAATAADRVEFQLLVTT